MHHLLIVALLAQWALLSVAQSCINTIAGSPNTDLCTAAITGATTAVSAPGSLFYVSSPQVLVCTADGSCAVVAGTPWGGSYSGEGVDARSANLQIPSGIAVNSQLDVLIADLGLARVMKVSSLDGTIRTIAGTGAMGTCGDGGPATSTCLNQPMDVAVDDNDNVYIADSITRVVRRVAAATGIITTVASGLERPTGIAMDPVSGALFIADASRVWRIAGGVQSLFAGNGQPGYSGDGGPATLASFAGASRVTMGVGTLEASVLIADPGNHAVRIVAPDGTISTFAGGRLCNTTGGAGAHSPACLMMPQGVSVNPTSSIVYVADEGRNQIVSFAGAAAPLQIVLGGGNTYCGDGTATSSCLSLPAGLAFTASAQLLVADSGSARLLQLDAATNTIVTIAGSGVSGWCPGDDGGPATAACIAPSGVGVDSATQDIYIADRTINVVRRIDSRTGLIHTIAGNGSAPAGYWGDGGAATSALLSYPAAVVVSNRTVFIGDAENARVRAVDLDTGIISTVAGQGCTVPGPDGIPATSACIAGPQALLFRNSTGDLLIGEHDGCRVRILYTNGTIGTLAGTVCASEDVPVSGDGGPATAAVLGNVLGLALQPSTGDVFITESTWDAHAYMRRVFAANGTVVRFAGANANSSFCGDGGPVSSACLFMPWGLAFDPIFGNLYVGDSGNAVVRAITMPETPSWSALCPAGYSCGCMRPHPCTSPSAGYCPGNATQPTPSAQGYYATGPDPSTGLLTTQRMCEAGSFCANGTAFACPAGTYGQWRRQMSAAACYACPAGTYNAVAQQVNSTGCLPCPGGTAAVDTGAAACDWCPPGTSSAGGGDQCTSCSNGYTLFGAADSCAPSIPGAAFAFTADVGVLELPPAAPLVPPPPSEPVVAVEVVIFAVFALPMFVMLWAALQRYACMQACATRCCSRCPSCPCESRGWTCAAPAWYSRCMRAVDQFGLSRTPAEGAAQVMKRTPLGGAVSIAGLGAILAIAVSLIMRYSASNTLVQRAVLPSQADDVKVVMSYPFAVRGIATTLRPQECLQGICVSIIAQGPECTPDNVIFASNASDLVAGEFVYTASDANTVPGSALYSHDFTCAACAFGRLSALTVTLPASCQSLAINVAAVGAQGSTAIISYSTAAAQAAAGAPFISGAAVAITPTIDGLNNQAAGVQARGYLILGAAPVITSSTSFPKNVTVQVSLAADADFEMTTVSSLTTPAQLVSSIIGLSGLMGGFAILFTLLEKHVVGTGEGSAGDTMKPGPSPQEAAATRVPMQVVIRRLGPAPTVRSSVNASASHPVKPVASGGLTLAGVDAAPLLQAS